MGEVDLSSLFECLKLALGFLNGLGDYLSCLLRLGRVFFWMICFFAVRIKSSRTAPKPQQMQSMKESAELCASRRFRISRLGNSEASALGVRLSQNSTRFR